VFLTTRLSFSLIVLVEEVLVLLLIHSVELVLLHLQLLSKSLFLLFFLLLRWLKQILVQWWLPKILCILLLLLLIVKGNWLMIIGNGYWLETVGNWLLINRCLLESISKSWLLIDSYWLESIEISWLLLLCERIGISWLLINSYWLESIFLNKIVLSLCLLLHLLKFHHSHIISHSFFRIRWNLSVKNRSTVLQSDFFMESIGLFFMLFLFFGQFINLLLNRLILLLESIMLLNLWNLHLEISVDLFQLIIFVIELLTTWLTQNLFFNFLLDLV